MKALINPNQDNFVVQVEDDVNIFDIGLPLFWVSCPKHIIPYRYIYKNDEFIQQDLSNNVTTLDPLEKLKQFLAANPDVAAVIS